MEAQTMLQRMSEDQSYTLEVNGAALVQMARLYYLVSTTKGLTPDLRATSASIAEQLAQIVERPASGKKHRIEVKEDASAIVEHLAEIDRSGPPPIKTAWHLTWLRKNTQPGAQYSYAAFREVTRTTAWDLARFASRERLWLPARAVSWIVQAHPGDIGMFYTDGNNLLLRIECRAVDT